MSRVGLLSVVLVGYPGDSVTRRLRRDTPFREIFVAYVCLAGLDLALTRFYYHNGEVQWGSTPGDLLFPDGGRIHVVSYGWLFSESDLEYFDQWVQPCPLRGGFYRRNLLHAERCRLRDLGYTRQLRVRAGRSEGFVSQLFGTHPGDFRGRMGHEEVILTQMEVVRKSGEDVQVLFFRQLDRQHCRLAGRWLYYGLYRMLVLTSGGVLRPGGVSALELGGFRIVYQMMGLIGRELYRARYGGRLGCSYHYDLRGYVGLAVRVMRVCRRRIGVGDALAAVGERVTYARNSASRAFVASDPGGMGVCPICQEGFELGGYGVLRCGHVMHRQCRDEYEAFGYGRAPRRLPQCSICRAPFEGFVGIGL
jgi:hypothetical protein